MAVALNWTGHVDTDLSFSEFFGSSHTWSLWFMPQYPNGYEGPCIAENGQGTFVFGQGSYSSDEPMPHLLLQVGSKVLTTQVGLKPRRWYHLALVCNVSGGKHKFTLFVGGLPISQNLEVSSRMADRPKGTVRFGKRTTGKTVNQRNAQFYGMLSDVAVFDKALTPAKVAVLAAQGSKLSGSESGLHAGYPLSQGSHSAKLSRPTSLRGAANLISAVRSGTAHQDAADAALIPLPSAHRPLDLPFKAGEAWLAGQSFDGTTSHWGLAEFAWDLTLVGPGGKYPKGTDGAPFYAAAPGSVWKVRKTAPSGTSEYSNYIDIKQAETEFASYIHLEQDSPEVKTRQKVTQGQRLAKTGDTGTKVGGFHLHFAVNDKPDQTDGFVTFPVAFSDYQAQTSSGGWKHVARGIPKEGDVIRNPPPPTFNSSSLDPASVVARTKDRLDLVATDRSGQLWVARWAPKTYVNNWDRFRPVLSDLGQTRPVGVVSRSKERLDIVSTNKSGRIYTGGRHEKVNSGLWGGWWNIKGLVAGNNAPVKMIARRKTQLDVFTVRNNGAISTAAWDQNVDDGKWRGWWRIGSGSAPKGSPVAAIARDPDKLDVFVVGNNGGVYTAAWDHNAANGKWRGWWRIGNAVVKQRSTITVVARDPRKLDIFVVGKNGGVYSAAWDPHVAQGKWRGWWRIPGIQARSGAPVTAVSRDGGKLDIFVVGKDGGVYSAAWDHFVSNGKWRGWWRIGNLLALQGAAVPVVARQKTRLDIFAVRRGGQMCTAAWNQHAAEGKWQGWWRVGG